MRSDSDLWLELAAEVKRFFTLDRIMWERLIRACGLRWQARYTQELAQRQRCAESVIRVLAQLRAPAVEVPSASAAGAPPPGRGDEFSGCPAPGGDVSMSEGDRRRS